ncbi:MAG TPA: cytidylate kinase family protein [Desulfomonilaceae bacterium]|nr:cytidylate kinase family protein [Desulfomonilaceae bacterium]
MASDSGLCYLLGQTWAVRVSMAILAISRQVGSYGDVIAAMVARNLGLELIGRDRVHELAQNCDPEYKDACSAYESEHGPGVWERIFYDRPVYTSLFEALTFEEAARGNVVMVGRGSQITLAGVPGVFKVRIVAPFGTRIRRVMERYGFSESEADDFVQRYDQERENLVRFIFHKDPHDWSLYDITINTDNYKASSAAAVVMNALDKMEKPDDYGQNKDYLTNMGTAKRIEIIMRTRLSSSAIRNVNIAVASGGIVTITGRVLDKNDKEEIERLVLQYPGITKVQNEIKFADLSYGIYS